MQLVISLLALSLVKPLFSYTNKVDQFSADGTSRGNVVWPDNFVQTAAETA